VAFAATGVGEVTEPAASGDVRILAVTTDEPVEGVDAPTLGEAGVDLTFTNWRGIVAAPDISEEERQRLVDVITEMNGSEAWQQVLEDQGWTESFVAGDEFGSFLDEESQRVQGVLSELGLT
jgi:putative tricarboxylic transport membrane protein